MKDLYFSALLLVAGITAVEVDYFEYGDTMAQTQKPTGEYLFDYDGNDMFHVDLDSKSMVWTLPSLKDTFYAQRALQELNIAKYNLDALIKRSNYSAAVSVPPTARVYTQDPVVLDELNTLICAVKNIFPPVMNMTWMKDGEKIDYGVTETIFLPSQDHSFRKYLFLAFVPTRDDIYTCEVEHWGLDSPTRILWVPRIPPVPSEATETLICALGLFVGFVGVIAGVILIVKGMRLNAQRRRRGH